MRQYLITGGTGTLGQALLKRLPSEEVIILSRDELKQQELRKFYPQLKMKIHNVEDEFPGLDDDIDQLFHFAAMKHVDVCEDNVISAMNTNFKGTTNAVHFALNNKVRAFHFTSTDKAVLPVNAYGMAKALSEKYLKEIAREFKNQIDIRIYRWGNIIGSRGSVIPYFLRCIRDSKTIHLTDSKMTRFWIPQQEAIDLMVGINIPRHCSLNQDVYLREGVIIPAKNRACPVAEIIELCGDLLGKKPLVKIVGIRPGEKLHESLSQQDGKPIITSKNDNADIYELCDLISPLAEEISNER